MRINKDKVLILDGAMGTMLQKIGLNPGERPELLSVTNPELITSIHRKYVAAGADIIYTNTFGANRLKLDGTGYSVADVVPASVAAARAACGGQTLCALDIGPLGEMLEPGGSLSFDAAYEAFKEVAVSGEIAGADLAVIETMTDLYEVKAAVLAVKENTHLPVFVSMSFEENGRTFTGCPIESMAATLEGLGADAVGINCSLGPVQILPLCKRLCEATGLPVFIKPNAGLPDPVTGGYDITPEQFRDTMLEYHRLGVFAVGGCCGTTPEYISLLSGALGRAEVIQRTRKPQSIICSATKAVIIDRTRIIGERINPTGKKRFQQALRERDFDYIIARAMEQIDAGADILDVNVGLPDIDEPYMLCETVRRLQAVTDLPLQIDSSDAEAVEAALRIYNGKPIVNSVNGEAEVLGKILPLCKKYGAAVVGLTLDKGGIPPTADGRVRIAERILAAAQQHGINKEDVFIDCLTLTASAQQEAVTQTLSALHEVKTRLGLRTVLGVSNISFGLPCRPLINRTFLAMALTNGLDMPIMNPNDEDMMGTVFAAEMLSARDINAARYIERYSSARTGTLERGKLYDEKKSEHDIFYTIRSGLKNETVEAAKKLLETLDEMTVINDHLIPALGEVGDAFEKGTLFLPQLLQAAGAAGAAFELIKTRLSESGKTTVSKGKIVIATVEGDIHDIGKNIVKVILENYGYQVIDLGRDVPVQKVVDAVTANDVRLLGLSALMTTTLPSMQRTIDAVKAAKPDCAIMVGGAVLTPDYAEKIGADYYCKDAMQSVAAAEKVLGGKQQ